jgi:aminoacrylate hydrolase
MAFHTLRDGATLWCETHGSGPPLMLVSGLGGAATFWNPHVAALSERFTVVLHDHRGTGRSTLSEMTYSVEQMTDDAVQLMDGLGIARAHWVGHSTGGAMGQTLALARPERLDRLVLSATWPKTDTYFRRSFEVRATILRELGAAAYQKASALALNPPFWIRDHEADLAAVEAQATATIPKPEIMLSRIAAIVAFDRRAELPRITCPTLAICARDDIVTPAYFTEDIGRLIPRCRTVILPDGGHFYPNIHGDAFRSVVTQFLTEPAVH